MALPAGVAAVLTLLAGMGAMEGASGYRRKQEARERGTASRKQYKAESAGRRALAMLTQQEELEKPIKGQMDEQTLTDMILSSFASGPAQPSTDSLDALGPEMKQRVIQAVGEDIDPMHRALGFRN